jgi:hypothetical protein
MVVVVLVVVGVIYTYIRENEVYTKSQTVYIIVGITCLGRCIEGGEGEIGPENGRGQRGRCL